MKTTQQKIEVMLAYLRGEKILFRGSGAVWLPWSSSIGEPNWNWDTGDYHIAPRPLGELWVLVGPYGLVDGGPYPTKERTEEVGRAAHPCAPWRAAKLREVTDE